jgi:hypothetical protein
VIITSLFRHNGVWRLDLPYIEIPDLPVVPKMVKRGKCSIKMVGFTALFPEGGSEIITWYSHEVGSKNLFYSKTFPGALPPPLWRPLKR